MAASSTNALTHFMHPAHKLTQLTPNTGYLCDGCKIPGTGTRFTCTICNFNLHDYCAKCPTRLTSTAHHPHPMSLVIHKPQPNHTQPCPICRHPIKGLAYQCKGCNFWVHPLCVSRDAGKNQNRATASGSGAAAQRIGEAVAVGLATNWIYDQIKEDGDEVPSAGNSNATVVDENTTGMDEGPSADESYTSGAGGDGDGGGFFDAIMSFFESSSS